MLLYSLFVNSEVNDLFNIAMIFFNSVLSDLYSLLKYVTNNIVENCVDTDNCSTLYLLYFIELTLKKIKLTPCFSFVVKLLRRITA